MRRAWGSIIIILGVVASIITIVFTWQQWVRGVASEAKFPFILLSFFLLVLLISLIHQEFRYSRKARYAEVLSYLNRIFLEIQAIAINRAASMEEIRQICTHFVNGLSASFSLITATKCAVCIKIIEGYPDVQRETKIRPKVITLCRDDMSREREASVVRVEHWIDQNTDFEQLHKDAGTPRRYYFSNYLPGIRGYKNTSFEIYGTPWDISMPIIADFLRDISWKLPYKSTIVVPISPPPDPQRRDYRLAGYLCLDSRSRGAFTRRYDLDIMIGAGYYLYEVVHRYCQLSVATQKEVTK